MTMVINQLCQQEPSVYWLGYWPSMQDIPGSNLARGTFFLCLLLSLLSYSYLSYIFVTRVSQSSSQTFSIITKNNHNNLFSCNLG